MPRNRIITAAALSVALLTVGAACSNDDGADVRNIGDECGGSGSASGASGTASGSTAESRSAPGGSASGSASGCGSASGSGSGIASEVGGVSTDNPLVQDAVAAYTT